MEPSQAATSPRRNTPFHLSVFSRRPDVGAVLHAHSPGLVAFSIARTLPDVNLIPTVRKICGELALATYAVPGSTELGENIAQKFDQGHSVVLLENHGVVIGAKDIFQAFMAFETIESSALLEINAKKLGQPRPLSAERIAATEVKNRVELPEFAGKSHGSEENAARRDLVKLTRRSYDQGLFTSTQGTYSVRLSDWVFPDHAVWQRPGLPRGGRHRPDP